MEFNNICAICFEYIAPKNIPIKFDCFHMICLKCFPYIAFNLLSNFNFSLNCRLLDSFEEKHTCPLCNKGKALQELSENQLYFLQNKGNFNTLEPQEMPICNLCYKKKGNFFCHICHKNNEKEGIMCVECAKTFHLYASKKNHLMTPIKEYLQNQKKNGCSCQKKKVDFYCVQCVCFSCQDCFEKSHKKHHFNSIGEITSKIERVPQNLLKNSMKSLLGSFKNEKNKLFKMIKTIIADEQKSFLNEIEPLIQKLIKFLELIKKQRRESFYFEMSKIKKKINLIDVSLTVFAQYANRNFSNSLTEELQILKDFSKNIDPMAGIEEETILNFNFKHDLTLKSEIRTRMQENIAIKNQLCFEEIQEITTKLGSLLKNFPLNTFKSDETIFNSSPLHIFQQDPLIIGKGCFNSWVMKSFLSCVFNIDNESYLAYAGCEEKKDSFSLIIYNISTRQRCHSIKLNPLNSYIQVVSTFPQNNNESTQKIKLLYVANCKGTVKCFDISSKSGKKFQELSAFQTDVKSDIVSVMIFEDKYKEIDDKSCIYAIVAFQNNIIMMYRLLANNAKNLEGSWEKFKKIKGLSKTCYTLNSFYDDFRSKTYLFFGFFEIPIQIYHLKENSWEKLTDNNSNNIILSMNFYFVKNPLGYYKRYLIYTQYESNEIIICDIDNKSIIKRIAIPNSHSVIDLLVWKCSPNTSANIHQSTRNGLETYLLVATRETYKGNKKGSLNIFTVEQDLSCVLKKSMSHEISPVNLIKAKVSLNNNKDSIFQNEKDTLIVIHGYGSNSSIALYEDKYGY